MNFNYWLFSLFIVLSYLVGSIPFGLILGKLVKNIDIRDFGSKNIGATNCLRTCGVKTGLLCFLLDIVKGGIFIILARILYLANIVNVFTIGSLEIIVIYGLFSVLGHCYPVYLKFKGGKAVSTTLGVILLLDPITAVIGFAIFLIVFFKTKIVSISSIVAAGSALITIYIMNFLIFKSFKETYITLIVVTIIIILLIIKHSSNIHRLKEGKEEKLVIVADEIKPIE